MSSRKIVSTGSTVVVSVSGGKPFSLLHLVEARKQCFELKTYGFSARVLPEHVQKLSLQMREDRLSVLTNPLTKEVVCGCGCGRKKNLETI